MAITAEELGHVADPVLVERYQAGDEVAFDTLYARHFAPLTRFCARRVARPDDAEEIAQEAFIRALGALPRFAGERRFYPWMTTIARRLCIDHHRKHGRVIVDDDVDPGSVDDGLDALDRAVDASLVRTALDNVRAGHREVLRLREVQEMSYAEIAEHLEVPQTTVEARLHRARKALRREYLKVVERMAALPLLAGLARSLDETRVRLGPRAADTVAAATHGVAGLAVVAAVAVAPLTAAPTSEVVHTEPGISFVAPGIDASAQAQDPTAPPEPAVPTGAVGGAPDESSPPVAADAGEADPTLTTRAPVDAAPTLDLYTGADGQEAAEERAKDMPLTIAAGGVTAGANPAAAVAALLGGSP